MPLNAFIIRPFGIKDVVRAPRRSGAEPDPIGPGQSSRTPAIGRMETVEGSMQVFTIDFDQVQEVLIAPALKKVGILGETASAVVAAGNIREDMFHRLMTADLVIADLSIHNANVFYELGIRQAFRDKYTFLMRCDVSDYPFDLKTDRYFEYEWQDPGRSVDRLTEALRMTISSDKPDSPVFKLLPKLEAEDRSRFITVPEEFKEEVDRARRYSRPGDLRLLAMEAEGYLWEIEGLREVGRAQFELNYIQGARLTWELVVARYPDDVEANTALSTIYQRLGDPARSEQALARVSRLSSLNASRLSQVRALQGRNLKARWVKDWKQAGAARCQSSGVADNPEQAQRDREERALRSPLLQRACDAYADAFKADLNNSYAGLNALGLLIIQTDLAERQFDLWQSLVRRPEDARRELDEKKARVRTLIATLQLSVESECDRLRRAGGFDVWSEMLHAAVEALVSAQPERVAQLYQNALLWAPLDAEQSMRSELQMYHDLGVGEMAWGSAVGLGTMKANVERALSVLRQEEARPPSDRPHRILLFTGLRVDPEGSASALDAGVESAAPQNRAGDRPRPAPRFPVDRVPDAKRAIREAVEAEARQVREQGGRILFGMAGGASGGDILFHRTCEDLQIESRMYLALPKEQYVGQYVAPAGGAWIDDFAELYRRRRGDVLDGPDPGGRAKIKVLADSKELPRWLQGKPFYNIGRRTNIWMLQHALVQGVLHSDAAITLIVLWDGETRGGSGGFGHLMRLAEQHGIKVRRIDRDQWQGRTSAGAPETVMSPPVEARGNNGNGLPKDPRPLAALATGLPA